MGYVLTGFFFLIGLALCVGIFGFPVTIILCILGILVISSGGK